MLRLEVFILFSPDTFSLFRPMLDFVSGDDPYIRKGYVLAVVFLIFNIVNAGIVHLFFKYSYMTAMRTRTAITTAVYRKVGRIKCCESFTRLALGCKRAQGCEQAQE